jgi:hypothetical protein
MTLAQELAALKTCSYRELQVKHAELFGETPLARNKPWLIKRIAWRLQANAEGDLSERAKIRIAELANDADLRVQAPRSKTLSVEQAVPVSVQAPVDRRLPVPGTILTRPYKGNVLRVEVREGGFAYEGVVYRTLSAVAKAITGSHCNGFAFFRLGGHP